MEKPRAGEHDPQVLRKVYFIKKAREGEELVTLLKNKFKTIDAIRDVLGWYAEGREFEIDLTDWTNGQGNPAADRQRYLVTRFDGPAAANRSIVGAIGRILNWLDSERPFDIALVPRTNDVGGTHRPFRPGLPGLN